MLHCDIFFHSPRWFERQTKQRQDLYRVGQKNRTCLSGDNSAMVSGRKTCDMSKVSECCKNKRQICILKHLSILCLICINRYYPLKLGICLHSYVPEFTELKNSLPKSPDLNSVNYSMWEHCNGWHDHSMTTKFQ